MVVYLSWSSKYGDAIEFDPKASVETPVNGIIGEMSERD